MVRTLFLRILPRAVIELEALRSSNKPVEVIVEDTPLVAKGPALIVFMPGNEEGNGVSFMLSDESDREAVFGDVTEADYRALCEYGAAKNLVSLEDYYGSSTPEHLDESYNEEYTNRQHYQLRITRANYALLRVYRDPQEDLREGVPVL